MRRIISVILFISVYGYLYAQGQSLSKNPTEFNSITTRNDSSLFPSLQIKSPRFQQLFGGNTIQIIPRGNIDFGISATNSRLQNPFLNEKRRNQWGVDFTPNSILQLTGHLGKKASFYVNYSNNAEFDFENQFQFNFTGNDNDIVKKIEIGYVNMPLKTSLIQGAESLFGIKTQVHYGAFTFNAIAAQKKTKVKEIILNNGSAQGEINISASTYEENQHYFLSHYFRNNYNLALRAPPIINSLIYITQIEVWIKGNSSFSTNSRNIIALLDLGEFQPYNATIQSSNNSPHPSTGYPGKQSVDVSNNLLILLGTNAKSTNNNQLQNFFQSSGGKDNYSTLTSARLLIESQDYTINRKLGYLSLKAKLSQEQTLAVVYRYTYKGKEYQVGEFSNDIANNNSENSTLFTKLLKSESQKTNLPTWDLMMKNIYNLQASNISEQNFSLQIKYLSQNTETPIILEGLQTKFKSWLELTNLDRITANNTLQPDGLFDWLPQITIEPKQGKLIFPIIEPFGKDLKDKFSPIEEDLIQKYTFQELYELQQYDVEQQFLHKNRYFIKGTYTTGSINEFYLSLLRQ